MFLCKRLTNNILFSCTAIVKIANLVVEFLESENLRMRNSLVKTGHMCVSDSVRKISEILEIYGNLYFLFESKIGTREIVHLMI